MKELSPKTIIDQFNMRYLNDVSTFGALTDEAIHWLLASGKLIEFAPDEALFTQSGRGDSFFVIIDGQVSYYKWLDTRYIFIRHYYSGQQIGFMSMVALHSRVGKAVADQTTWALEISSEVFQKLHESHPSDFGILMMNLAREMARTLCDAYKLAAKREADERD